MISSKQPVVPFQSLSKFNALLRVGNFIFIKNVPDKTCENCVQFKVLLNRHIFESHSSMTRYRGISVQQIHFLHTLAQGKFAAISDKYFHISQLFGEVLSRQGGKGELWCNESQAGGEAGRRQLQLGFSLNKS